jgi:hypothetical protein
MTKAKIRVNKLEAASRQIDTAIRMTFSNEDPIAIHSIAAASRQIIKDICEIRGDIEGYLRFTNWIAEGHEKEFWNSINRSANFLKHADRDANAIHEMDAEENDFVILLASKWYHDLGCTTSLEMRTFIAWIAMCHPNFLTSDAQVAMAGGGVDSQFHTMSKALVSLPRSEQLKAGQLMLTQGRKATPSGA